MSKLLIELLKFAACMAVALVLFLGLMAVCQWTGAYI